MDARRKDCPVSARPIGRADEGPDGQAAANWASEPVNPRLPISPQIYERLRRSITTLAILPSESLSEKDLAGQLGVSRTPVREAFIRLADEGLIDIFPQRGSFVAPIRMSDVEEAQFIREALEVAVVRRLAGRASASFLAAGRGNLVEQGEPLIGATGSAFWNSTRRSIAACAMRPAFPEAGA